MKGYGQARWQRARVAALKRARYRCERPGCTATTRLRVHHKDGLGMSGARACDPTNLVVLCHKHHIQAHKVDRVSGPEGTAVVVRNSHLG